MSKLRCEECLLERERNNELQAELDKLRRSIDNVKVRAYELGQKELQDMALAALLEVKDEQGN